MNEHESWRIAITGVVQGVGFRPFVYNLALRLGLKGWVLNHSGGVEIEVEGPHDEVARFITSLRQDAPPLAHITSLTSQPTAPRGYDHFEIRHSERQAGHYQLISPDVATCPDCLRELFDPQDRRYRYPFINCTNCGPRFTIIKDIPYDRDNTTMRVFPLCPDCRAEYEDPTNRRFHAQPNACPTCGPHVWLTEPGQEQITAEAALQKARELLLSGKILAIKGLGGFHLACDATNAQAVQTLRERKHRPHKPFAVMMATLADVKAHCEVPPAAASLLSSPQAPIVLLERRPAGDGPSIVAEVAPHQRRLGVMLPSTPLHHILLRDAGRPLVMTSGNLTEEPIAKDNDEALRRLASLADAFLLHNRDIHARYDDSVVQLMGSTVSFIRRARGYAPFPIQLPFTLPQIFATGPLLKNTFTLTRDANAFLSQHIGDMENLETLAHYEAALATFEHLFRITPEAVVCDQHPDYLTTHLAERYARERGLPPPTRIQHHRAHIAACLADNARPLDAGPVIGVAFDGTGYGDDGAIWGGEWFVGDYEGFERVAHLEYLPLPGGDAAIRHPWRIAVAYLHTLLDEFPAGIFCPADALRVRQQITHRLNTPQTSSAGRLFDAVSALLGVCQTTSYEAQAAIELEQIAAPGEQRASYDFGLEKVNGVWQVRLAPLFESLLSDTTRARRVPEIAWRFHKTVAEMIATVCERIRAATDISTVALSGGVFQNRLLLQLTRPLLAQRGFEVLLHRQVPPNDGGVSLGQAVLGWRIMQNQT